MPKLVLTRSVCRRCRSGLSLAETTVTILILGVMAAVAIPRWTTSLGNQRARSAIRAVEADMRTAMRQAALRSVPVSFRVQTGTAKIEFTPPINDYVTTSSETVDYSARFPGVTFSDAVFDDQQSGKVDIYQQLLHSATDKPLSKAMIALTSGTKTLEFDLLTLDVRDTSIVNTNTSLVDSVVSAANTTTTQTTTTATQAVDDTAQPVSAVAQPVTSTAQTAAATTTTTATSTTSSSSGWLQSLIRAILGG